MPHYSYKSYVNVILGSTNTGKTHFAIEKMLTHKTGVIGFPLRLLAREVFDKVVKRVGPSQVALITGEERIVPNRACYWICTTEAMPTKIGADFLAVDEIQLCSDLERGHIFTDRLLHARGQKETLFLGSENIKQTISNLLDNTFFERRDRFSSLTYTGKKDIARLEPRTAIVGFSLEDVYYQAEMLRSLKGGAAVVTGGLSPRTRNAQVDIYQNGEVNYLVATDAIGMGLNLEIDHVAFSRIRKFDGRRHRGLTPMETGQIAGRAGRYKKAGTFGIVKGCEEIPLPVVQDIENNRYSSIKKIQWRNTDLDYRSLQTLLKSLSVASKNPILTLTKETTDILVLKELIADDTIQQACLSPSEVKLFWEACQIPDFRNAGIRNHSALVSKVFWFLKNGDYIPEDWLNQQLDRIDKTEGGIESLSANLASIRNWTYVAQKPNWVEDTKYWRERTRGVEDRLSDSLHRKLTNRFIDVKVSVLLRKLRKKEQLVPEIKEDGGIEIEGQNIGKLEGFRFFRNIGSTPDEEKVLKEVTSKVIGPQFDLLANKIAKAPNPEFDFTEQGGIMWGTQAVGKLVKGDDPYDPKVRVFVDKIAGEKVKEKVQSRIESYVDQRIKDDLENLLKLKNDQTLEGEVREFAQRIVEEFGILRRDAVTKEVTNLDQDKRKLLRAFGIRFGQFSIFEISSIKPYPTRLRLVLWSLQNSFPEFPPSPPLGLTSLTQLPQAPEGYFPKCGYFQIGSLAIRVDILERLMNLIRVEDGRKGFGPSAEMLSITGLSHEMFSEFMKGLGYKVIKEENLKAVEPPTQDIPSSSQTVETDNDQLNGSEERVNASDSSQQVAEITTIPEQPVPDSPVRVESKDVKAEITNDNDVSLSSTSNEQTQSEIVTDDEENAVKEIVYTYKWSPKRTAPPKKKFSNSKTNDQSEKKEPFKAKKGRGPRGKFDKKTNPRNTNRSDSKRPRNKKPFTRKPDPNHPFAALLEIRDKL